MATNSLPTLKPEHKHQRSEDSGLFIDWNSDSGSPPRKNSGSENDLATLPCLQGSVKGDFVTVVAVEGNEEVVTGNKHDDASFVTVVAVGTDDSVPTSVNVTMETVVDNESAQDIGFTDEVLVVYRLPGERLGFGLKFEGGNKNSDSVGQLFIQSCAVDSPASRTLASWGNLIEGDEILEIDGHSVPSMTRLDCVQCLKEASVAVKLKIRHNNQPPITETEQINNITPEDEPREKSSPPPPVPPRRINRRTPVPPPREIPFQPLIPPKGFEDSDTSQPSSPAPRPLFHPDLFRQSSSDLVPPEPEVYLDLLSKENSFDPRAESESDDTGSTVSTVLSRTSRLSISSTQSFGITSCCESNGNNKASVDKNKTTIQPASPGSATFDITKVLDPFEQLEREFPNGTTEAAPVIPCPSLCKPVTDGECTSENTSITPTIETLFVNIPLDPPVVFQDLQNDDDLLPSPQLPVTKDKQKNKTLVQKVREKCSKIPKLRMKKPPGAEEKVKSPKRSSIPIKSNEKSSKSKSNSEKIVPFITGTVAKDKNKVDNEIIKENGNFNNYHEVKGQQDTVNSRVSDQKNENASAATLREAEETGQMDAAVERSHATEYVDGKQIVDEIMVMEISTTSSPSWNDSNNRDDSDTSSGKLNSDISLDDEKSRDQQDVITSEEIDEVLSSETDCEEEPEEAQAVDNAKNNEPPLEPPPSPPSSIEEVAELLEENSPTELTSSAELPDLLTEIFNPQSSAEEDTLPVIIEDFIILHDTLLEDTDEGAKGFPVMERAVVSLIPQQDSSGVPSFSRLPPDGHEFPNDYQEPSLIEQKLTMDVDDCTIPPSLPESSPPPPMGKMAKFRSVSEDRTVLLMKSDRRFKRQDEKSEKSVRDKIAMFSSVVETSLPVPRPLSKYQSSDDMTRLSGSGRLTRSFTQEDVRTERTKSAPTQETAQLPPTPPPVLELTSKRSNIQLETNLHERSQSLVELMPTLRSKRHSIGVVECLPPQQDEQVRKVSLNAMIENRRKSMSKLRGLVIPERNEVVQQSSTILMPKIISREPVLVSNPPPRPTTNGTVKMSTPVTLSNDVIDGSHALKASPWIQQNIPKYSPAFQRKHVSVYKTTVNNDTFTETKKIITTSTLRTTSPGEPKSLESIGSPRSEGSFEFPSSPLPATPPPIKTIRNSFKKPGCGTRTDDSDNDSAVSSSRSSISHGLSPPLSPTPETPDKSSLNRSLSDAKRILKPDTVEAINRKNVLQSARYRSGKLLTSPQIQRRSHYNGNDEEIEADDEEGSSPESCTSELEPSSLSSGPTMNESSLTTTEDELGGNTPPCRKGSISPYETSHRNLGIDFSNPIKAIEEMELQVAYMNQVCDGYVEQDQPLSCIISHTIIETTSNCVTPSSNDMNNRSSDSFLTQKERRQLASSTVCDVESDISLLEKTVSKVVSEDRWLQLTEKYGNKNKTVVELKNSVTNPVVTKTDTTPVKKDFKALASKWQQLSEEDKTTPVPSPIRICHPRQSSWGSKQESLPKICEVVTKSVSKTCGLPEVVGVERKIDVPKEEPKMEEEVQTENNDESPSNQTEKQDVVSPPPPTNDEKVLNTEICHQQTNGDTRQTPLKYSQQSVNNQEFRKAFDSGIINEPLRTSIQHLRMSSLDSTASEDSFPSAPTHAMYGSSNSLGSIDPFGSVTSLASTASLISPQELQVLVEEASQYVEEPHRVVVVTIHRGEIAGGGIGITLAGGADQETREITVHRVIAGSLAAKDGRVQRGDRVLSINGKSLKAVGHREALSLLKAPRPEVVLVLSRCCEDPSPMSSLNSTLSYKSDGAGDNKINGTEGGISVPSEAIVPTNGVSSQATIILQKEGGGLGFSLEGGKDSPMGDRALLIKKIFIGGIAEKSGFLKSGDEIISIGSTDVTSMSRIDAWNLMKKLPDGSVPITIIKH